MPKDEVFTARAPFLWRTGRPRIKCSPNSSKIRGHRWGKMARTRRPQELPGVAGPDRGERDRDRQFPSESAPNPGKKSKRREGGSQATAASNPQRARPPAIPAMGGRMWGISGGQSRGDLRERGLAIRQGRGGWTE